MSCVFYFIDVSSRLWFTLELFLLILLGKQAKLTKTSHTQALALDYSIIITAGCFAIF